MDTLHWVLIAVVVIFVVLWLWDVTGPGIYDPEFDAMLNRVRADITALMRERDHLRARLTRTGTARTAAEKRVAEVLDELKQASTDRDAALAKLRAVHRASAESTVNLTKLSNS